MSGQQLDRAAVAARVGWSDPNHVNVARRRTRAGTASVPFPDPDGTALLEVRVNRETHEDWWSPATIDRYIAQRRGTRSRARKIGPDLAARIRALRVDGLSVGDIAIEVSVSKATVSRVLNSPPPQREDDHGK